jgi:hypothetical protein
MVPELTILASPCYQEFDLRNDEILCKMTHKWRFLHMGKQPVSWKGLKSLKTWFTWKSWPMYVGLIDQVVERKSQKMTKISQYSWRLATVKLGKYFQCMKYASLSNHDLLDYDYQPFRTLGHRYLLTRFSKLNVHFSFWWDYPILGTKGSANFNVHFYREFLENLKISENTWKQVKNRPWWVDQAVLQRVFNPTTSFGIGCMS